MTPAAAGSPVVASARPITDRAWFDRPAAEIAPDLLGALLIHDSPLGRVVGRIVEVEAYQGPEDLAAHSSRGLTARNAVMFGPAGHLYVYLVYGLHHCANVVCGPGAKPEAVLLRAAQVVDGVELARERRGDVPDERLAAGPGNLGAAFGIDRDLNGADLLSGPVRLAVHEAPAQVERSPRVGVDYAGAWAAEPLRFSIADDPHRSRG
ncbi:MAG TPA: DNA-3-methyladenine glycosylase [Candidatus Limnocylindria bacterium]|nr:DNA-3-methyladenine glycosylase [Candidatus Limnocylindria bacterium]